MKNLLNEKIKELENTMMDYPVDFVNDYCTRDSSAYICDAISEFADSNTSIYYSNIMEYIKDNPDAVNNAIDEFGWDGCGSDIYKAGQMAEYMEIQNELYSELDNIIYLAALKILNEYDTITAEQLEKVEEIEFEGIDQNSRIEDIHDYVKNIMVGEEE